MPAARTKSIHRKRGTAIQEVVVHFDGAWDPPGEADFFGWGFTARGAGFNHRGHRANVGLRVVNSLFLPVMRAMGYQNEPGQPTKLVHRSPMMPELEAALEALSFLKEHGYRGRVVMKGDGKGLITLLQPRGKPREGTADADMLSRLLDSVFEICSTFVRVRWEWVPREENQEADDLARAAMEEIYSHQQSMKIAIEKHRDVHPLASLLGDLLMGTLPNRLDRRPVRLEDCTCGICRRATGVATPGPDGYPALT